MFIGAVKPWMNNRVLSIMEGNNKCKIFYSWQSDNTKVRNFIMRALESIRPEDIGMEVEIDHDTAGLPGSPKIEDAIIDKIKTCDLFVADVTIINQGWEGRKLCNPNVLFELGVAVGHIGWDRIALVYCNDYGDIEYLPFDFNHNRMISFSIEEPQREFAKKNIKSRVCSSIQILQSKGLIHGGNPYALETMNHLYFILTKSIQNIIDESIIGVYSTEIERLNSIRHYLSEDNYGKLYELLSTLIAISADYDDSGFHITRLSEKIFDKLYLEFKEDLPNLQLMDILSKPFYDAMNCLLPQELRKPYSFKKMIGDYLVFSSEPKAIIAYSEDKDLLISGSLNDHDLFSGFQVCRDSSGLYIGEFKNGLRSGQGTMYVKYNDDCPPALFCKGLWEKDVLIEGKIFGVNSYQYVVDELTEKGLPAEQYLSSGGFFLNGCPQGVEDGLCPVFDLQVKEGIARIIPNTLQRCHEDVFGDEECLLDIYRKRMSKYDYLLEGMGVKGGNFGLDYEFIANRLYRMY